MDELNSNQEGMEAPSGQVKSSTGMIVAVIAVIVLLAAAAYAYFGRTPEPTQNQETTNTLPTNEPAPGPQEPSPTATTTPDTATSTPPVAAAATVTRTDSGFSPSPLAVKVGSTVTFKNTGANPSWPASAMHPTHSVYPGSDISKCETSERTYIFDACKGLATGESWSFKFNSVGTWNYHDHLNASKFGTIIVTP